MLNRYVYFTNQEDLISFTVAHDPDCIQLLIGQELNGGCKYLKKQPLEDLITAREALLNEHLENAKKLKAANAAYCYNNCECSWC